MTRVHELGVDVARYMRRRDNLTCSLFPDAVLPQDRPPPPPPGAFKRPELQSAAYWAHELARAATDERHAECYENMIASLKALDQGEEGRQ